MKHVNVQSVKAFGRKVMFELPKNIGVYWRDFKQALPLLQADGSTYHTLSREDFQRVAYTARQYQKLSGFIGVTMLPFVGATFGAVGLMLPRNVLTRHFWTDDEERGFLLLEHVDVRAAQAALTQLRPLHVDAAAGTPCQGAPPAPVVVVEGLQGLDKAELLHLSTALGVRMFGDTRPMAVVPRSFLRRWLEIKCRDTAIDDELIRGLLTPSPAPAQAPAVPGTGAGTDAVAPSSSERRMLPSAHLCDMEVLRAAASRGIDPSLSPLEIRTALVRWVTSKESRHAFPPPPLTPNLLEKIGAAVFTDAGSCGNESGQAVYGGSSSSSSSRNSSDICDSGGAIQTGQQQRGSERVMTRWQTAKLFARFAASPVTNGPRVVQAHRDVLQGRGGGGGMEAHAQYLFDLTRLNAGT